MKIKKKNLYVFILLSIIYYIVFLDFPYLPSNLIIDRCLMIFLFILIIPYIINVLKNTDKMYILLFASYFTLVMISALINRNAHTITHVDIAAFGYVVAFFEMLCIVKICVDFCGFKYLIKFFLFFSLLSILINDALLLANPNVFGNSYFFLGNKFAVTYKHLEAIVFTYMYEFFQNKKSVTPKVLHLILIAVSVGVSITSDCMTGFVGIVILIILIKLIPNELLNHITYVATVFCSTVFVFIYQIVLSTSFAQNLIVNVLHRDLNLTARTEIFQLIPRLIQGNILWGFGYSSSYEVWIKATHVFPNSQNGLIDMIFEQGILATIVFLLIIAILIKFCIQHKISRLLVPLLGMLFTRAVLSAVEITFDFTMIGWVSLLYTYCIYIKKEFGYDR